MLKGDNEYPNQNAGSIFAISLFLQAFFPSDFSSAAVPTG